MPDPWPIDPQPCDTIARDKRGVLVCRGPHGFVSLIAGMLNEKFAGPTRGKKPQMEQANAE